jgi:uncharacterized lipoprotein YmbA
MKIILIIVIALMITACATTEPNKCDAYGSVETSKDLAKK